VEQAHFYQAILNGDDYIRSDQGSRQRRSRQKYPPPTFRQSMSYTDP